MSKIMGNFSYCLGVYNEEKIVLSQIQKIKEGLDQRFEESSFEILIVDNGSTDRTPGLLKTVDDSCIRVFYLPAKGLGSALKLALEKAHYDRAIFNAIDLPFGFTDLDETLKHWNAYDLIFGSKSHPDSEISRSLPRNIAAFFHRLLLRIFFDVKVRDSQGSLFLKRSSVLGLLNFCDAKNAFFTAQISIYASLFKLRILEVPVILRPELRPSKFNLLIDGWLFLVSMIKEYPRYLRHRVQETVIK